MIKPTAARPPFWLPPPSLLAIALILWPISFYPPTSFVPPVISCEAFGLIIVLRLFCYWPPMRRWVASMPVPHRLVFALLLGAMILGHYTVRSRAYFPFVAWEIFPAIREDNPVKCPEFLATTMAGKQVRLLVEQLFPSIVQINPLEARASDLNDRLALVMAKAYNERHPDDPVRSIDLVVVAVHLRPSADESVLDPIYTCKPLKHYDISSGR